MAMDVETNERQLQELEAQNEQMNAEILGLVRQLEMQKAELEEAQMQAARPHFADVGTDPVEMPGACQRASQGVCEGVGAPPPPLVAGGRGKLGTGKIWKKVGKILAQQQCVKVCPRAHQSLTHLLVHKEPRVGGVEVSRVSAPKLEVCQNVLLTTLCLPKLSPGGNFAPHPPCAGSRWDRAVLQRVFHTPIYIKTNVICCDCGSVPPC